MNKENKKEPTDKKKTIKKIIKITLIIVVGIIVICLLPFISIILSLLYRMFIDVPSKPKIKHGEFPFELVYEYKGEQKTITDTIICKYEGDSFALDGGNSRNWICEFKNDDEYGHYYIDKENEPDLFIVVPDAPDYYMGDKKESKDTAEPYIRYIDEKMGTYYEEKEKIDVVDIKIIEWKPSEPIQNSFK